MKFRFVTLVASLLFLNAFAAHETFGQDVVMTKAAFDKVMLRSFDGWEGKARRQTTVVEQFLFHVSQPGKTRREIYETLPPDRTREVNYVTVKGKEQCSERIEIGDKAWSRICKGRWSADYSGHSGSDTAAISTSEKFLSKGKSTVDGTEFSVYQKIETLTTYKLREIVREEISTTTTWIDKDGRVKKSVRELEDTKTHQLTRFTDTNELDPKDLLISVPTPTKSDRTRRSDLQVKISAQQFDDATRDAHKTVPFPARSRSTEEFFEDGIVFKTITTEFEGTPGENSREMITESERGLVKKFETIEAGKFLYKRKGNGKWSKEPWYFRHTDSSDGYSSVLHSETYWKETVKSGRINYAIFRSSVDITRLDENVSQRIRDEEYYFIANRFLKQVTTERDRSDPTIIITRNSYTSQHDQSLKIRPPIR